MNKKVISKIVGISLVLLVSGVMLGGLVGTKNVANATAEKTTISVTDPSPWFAKGSYSGHPEYWDTYTYNGHAYIYTYVGGMPLDPSQPDYWVEFRPYLSETGEYEVYASFYADPQNSTKVPHTVYYDGGSITVPVNQYAPNYFTWTEKKLGTWDFAAGESPLVRVTDATGELYDGATTLNVDTIRFVKVTPTITDQQKQQELLNMVNNHRGLVPPELILAIIRQEGGEGAFHVDGWNYNSFYTESDGPWAQPTNGDGIMQVTVASGYHQNSGTYTNDQTGYDHAINDGCDYLLEHYNTYASYVQTTLHYNTGPSSLYIYLGLNAGDRDYLSNVAGHLINFVPNTYGLQNQELVDILTEGQNILNDYLYNMGIEPGQAVSYYQPYQAELDNYLHNIEHPPPPPTCSIELREQDSTSLINEINVGQFFDIYVVRF